MKKAKICFVGLYEERNYGDPIIAHCTEWLVLNHVRGDYEVVRMSLDYVEKHRLSFFKRVIRKSKKIIGINESSELTIINDYKSYFSKNIKDVDLVIVVGGGLIKYSYQYFYAGLYALLDTAEVYEIPVVFNSVGVEGYDASNSKCLKLKNALRKKALVSITTRDDISTLVDCYFDGQPTIPCKKVADPAVWAKEAFGVERQESDIVGIGIGRGGLFIDNGKNFTEEQFFDLYISIIRRLYIKGLKLCLFTNGMSMDNIFALKIQQRMKEERISLDLRIPTNAKELVQILASFRCIMAARLHSCIVAYSLGVPSMGFVWNDKLRMWGENINAEEYFIEVENLNVDYLEDRMNSLLYYKYDSAVRKLFRNSILDNVSNLVEKYINPYLVKLTNTHTGGVERV